MSMIKENGEPWQGPGFDFEKPKGNWPSISARPPSEPVDDINSIIAQTLKRADEELLEEEGTGEFIEMGKEFH